VEATKVPIQAEDAIVGTWRLVSFTEENIQTKAMTYPLGQKANAFVIYGADGYVSTIFTAGDRKPPASAQATDEEALQLYRSMVAFAGRYEVEGNKLLYHPLTSWNEAWNGVTQTRLWAVDEDRLQVKSVPVTSTLTGTETVFSLLWERAR